MYKPPTLLSPGDIFPAVPCSFLSSPLKVSRKSGFTPPSERGPQEFRRIYTHPKDTKNLNPVVALDAQKGEECLAVARIGSTILLTYECTVEADMKDRERAGVQLSRIWHVAPIFDLGKIPADARIVNEATGESILMRDVVKGNASANYFYLDPLPDARDDVGHYVDFRKLAPISVEYLIPEMDKRLVTLNEDALNGCLNQLMWFFTRAKYLHEPVACPHCGKEVNLAEVLEGQELDLQQ